MDFKKFAAIVGGTFIGGTLLVTFGLKRQQDQKKKREKRNEQNKENSVLNQPSKSQPHVESQTQSLMSNNPVVEDFLDFEYDDIPDSINSDQSPNDQRSNVMNPNNDPYDANQDNRTNQMNPNNDAYWSSRSKK